jgi:protocatechuate 3,4-dioxygenase beta subunit
MSNVPRRVLVVLALVVAALVAWLALRPSRDGTSTVATSGDPKATGPSSPIAKRVIDGEVEAEQGVASLRPWRGASATIRGRVHDESGKPVGGAMVCAKMLDRESPTDTRRVPKCTNAGPDGRYTLTDVAPVETGISASAPTFVPGRHIPPNKKRTIEPRAGVTLENVDIELRSGGVEIRGIVKDIAGGVVEDALVSTGGGNWGRDVGLSIAYTDAEGAFSLWTKPGDVYVLAEAEGYAQGGKGGAAPGYTFELLLTPESVVGGRVVDAATGKPVADARVTVESEGGWGSDNVTYTDEAGKFRVARLEPGRYVAKATTIDRFGTSNESRRVGLGEAVEDFEVKVHPSASISGHVVIAGEEPTPCEDGGVSVVGRTTKHDAWEGGDREGLVVVQGLPPDTYDISVHCEGAVGASKYEPVVLAEAPVDGLVWEVERGLTLAGIVIDESGTPIEGASVDARQTDAAARTKQSAAWGQRTGKDGKFVLEGLRPGTYEIEAEHEDHVAPEKPLTHVVGAGGNAEVTLTLGAGGTIEGRVVDAKRRPVSGAQVQLVGKIWQPGASTKDDGTFRIERVRPGEHRAKATTGWTAMRAPGTSDDDLQGVAVSVRVGEVTEIELVVEEQFGSISGRVVDADGGPVDDAFVSYSRESDSAKATSNRARRAVRWSWDEKPVLTDESGAFALDRIPTGKHTLIAQRKGGGEGLVEHIETGSTGVVIKLTEGASISGTVVLAGGGNPERFTISANDEAQGVWRTESFMRTSGVFRIGDLPPGKYVVAVSATEGAATTTVELTGAGKDDVRLELAPRVDVTGTIVDLQTGEPVPNMMVTISPAKGQNSFSFSDAGDQEHVSDESGAFTVRAAPTGAVRIMVVGKNFFASSSGKNYGWTRTRATIPADQKTFTLPPIKVAATRTEGRERGGDLGFGLSEIPPESEPEDLPLKVAVVRPGGPASTTELKVGDVIVQVDGHDVTGDNRYLYGSLTRVKEGDSVTLGLEGGGKVTIVAGKPV